MSSSKPTVFRRPVGIASLNDGGIAVLCDDGAVFYNGHKGEEYEWILFDKCGPIPGTEAAWIAEHPEDIPPAVPPQARG